MEINLIPITVFKILIKKKDHKGPNLSEKLIISILHGAFSGARGSFQGEKVEGGQQVSDANFTFKK